MVLQMIRGKFLIFLVLLLSGSVSAAEKNAAADYAFAQKCYHELDKTLSQGWDPCIAKFQEVIYQYPESEQAYKAYFSAARLTQEKYGLTKSKGDLQQVFNIYNQFLKKYSKSSLSDDALYHIGVLRYEAEGDSARARHALQVLIERYPYGDMAVPASEYLQKLNQFKEEVKIVQTPLTKEEPKPVITVGSEVREGEMTKQTSPVEVKEVGDTVEVETLSPQKTAAIIVIDPGHGGEDAGAVGFRGTKEAVVALQVARKVAFKLKKEYGYDVYLTRTNNRTVSLDQRNDLANQKKADLFVSIHANAHGSKKVKGVQTFYLNNATNKAAELLAVRENRSAKKPLETAETILNTMLQNANTEDSRLLASIVHRRLITRMKEGYPDVKDLDVDSAVFQVLFATKCPSILVETSYITNPEEELKLRDTEYQWTIAEGVARGVKEYIDSRGTSVSSSSL